MPGERPAGVGAGWFDSHCHLQEEFLPEAEAGAGPVASDGLAGALARSGEAGVERMVCVGTDAETSRQALALAAASAAGRLGDRAPAVWATAGLHPHQASEATDAVATLVADALGSGDPLVAVGECGLDYHYEHSPRADQRRAFAEQIALAHEHRLALVIHAREAWDDLFDVLTSEGVPERTVLHCFTGGPVELARCLEAPMWVSFSGIVTFKGAGEVREAAARCPARSAAGRDRQPVPGARAPPRPAQRARLRAPGGCRGGRAQGHRPGHGGRVFGPGRGRRLRVVTAFTCASFLARHELEIRVIHRAETASELGG